MVALKVLGSGQSLDILQVEQRRFAEVLMRGERQIKDTWKVDLSEENGVTIIEIGVTVRNAWKQIQSVDLDMFTRQSKEEWVQDGG